MESPGFGRAAFVDEEQGFVRGKNAVGIIAVYVPLPDEPPQCVTFQNLLPDMVQQVKAFARGMEVREPQVLVARLSAPVYGEVECPVRVEHMQAMCLFVLNVYLVPVCLEPGGVCYRFFRVGQGDEGATGRVQPLVGAGRNKPHGPLFDALAILSGAGYLIRIHETSAPGDAADTAAREGAGYDLVVAAGGDGTLNEVISGLMRLDAPPPLGYLPQGTTNDFASSLQIPRTPASAAKNIVQNRMRELDIGRWNERSFIYVASFGAFTRSSYAASQAAKNALGHFAYILEGMKDLNTLRPYHIRLTADGEVLDGDYLFGAVCNSTSIGGLMKLDPERVVLDDGKFEMLLVPSPKTAADLQNLVLALLNQQYDSQGLVFRHVSSLRLETEEELPWSLDGEYAPSVPVVDIVNRQRALRMLL